jgi:hypothetical protein
MRWYLSKSPVKTSRVSTVDMKLEVIVIPVSDADRAKRFYGELGWRLDIDYTPGDDHRVIQFTPPGSGCSVIFGKNVTTAAPGSVKGLHLIVSTSRPPVTCYSAVVSALASHSTTPAASSTAQMWKT